MNVAVVVAALAIVVYLLVRMLKKKKPDPFPEKWRPILLKWVNFYTVLIPSDRIKFERGIMRFLSEVRITAVETELEDLDIVLVASSSLIPLFNFPEWEYRNLSEVVLYPNSFNHEFEITGSNRQIRGMVGSGGPMEDTMILSKKALRNGFRQKDKSNVGIHEFIHLLDMADGSTDGIPKILLEQPYIIPWIKLMEVEMDRIQKGNSSIRKYGSINEAEFLSVVSEYFFGQPKLLKKKHPDLYTLMQKMYRVK